MFSTIIKAIAIFVLALSTVTVVLAQSGEPDDRGIEQRSLGRELGDEVRQNGLSLPIQDDGPGNHAPADREEAGLNVQVNDAALDHIVVVPGTRPFEFSIQSETSIAVAGNNILVGYNSSADQPIDHVDPV